MSLNGPTERSHEVLSPQFVHPNFRDLGGHHCIGGKKIRKGCLFRSSHLGILGDEARREIEEIGFTHIFDLRGCNERLAAPCTLNDVEIISLPIEPVVESVLMAHLSGAVPLDNVKLEQIGIDAMCASYRQMVHALVKPARKILEYFVSDQIGKMVVHCNAGKDRTGLMSALFLRMLEVPNKRIVGDYLLSNRFLKIDPTKYPGIDQKILTIAGSVDERFLLAAWREMEDSFGGFNRYLERELGINKTARNILANKWLS